MKLTECVVKSKQVSKIITNDAVVVITKKGGEYFEKIRLKTEIGRWVDNLTTARPAVFCEHIDCTEFAVAIVENGVIVC